MAKVEPGSTFFVGAFCVGLVKMNGVPFFSDRAKVGLNVESVTRARYSKARDLHSNSLSGPRNIQETFARGTQAVVWFIRG